MLAPDLRNEDPEPPPLNIASGDIPRVVLDDPYLIKVMDRLQAGERDPHAEALIRMAQILEPDLYEEVRDVKRAKRDVGPTWPS
jgi:hypothetical protein